MKTTKQILKNINESGGFDNFRNWKLTDLTTWLISNYNCSRFVGKRVASKIIK